MQSSRLAGNRACKPGTRSPIATFSPEFSGTLPSLVPVRATAAARNANRSGPALGRSSQGSVTMNTKATPSARALGGWAIFADFSGLLLKASAAGVAVSLVAGAVVLLVALAG